MTLTEQQLAFCSAALRAEAVHLVLQQMLDSLLHPTDTAYRGAPESWQVIGVPYLTEDDRLRVIVVPPRSAFEWHQATADNMQQVQKALGCTHLCVRSYTYPDGKEAIRFDAEWQSSEEAAAP